MMSPIPFSITLSWKTCLNMPRERDPFPFPRFENDHTFNGSKEIQKLPYDKPAHLAQNDEPWRRLHNTGTMASSRRNIFYRDITAPKDSLDIHLKSTYDNHLGLFQNKSQTLTQRETVAENHATLKNREQLETPVCENENKGMKVWVDSQKASIYSIKGTIESHHTASTNRGYSRKHDGGFYTL
ncbi:cilia- and flagella-associated protein 276 isoform X2 [Myxocyprinus asiaticus]|uniref:cilia- and flagella-associated protein 276 isoform X2 n=1 Tax=Myxocyprinus asiaticus TaxID=70543 RepID=UPI002221A123|nr:cilia- and flagella-associated protein 276 isoform X2 [Myxocyprinus asiaticus]